MHEVKLNLTSGAHIGTMGISGGNSEIEPVGELHNDASQEKHCMQNPGLKYSIEDDINRLFEAIGFQVSGRGMKPSQTLRENLHKKYMKRPVRVSSSQASGIGISEPANLKQALRGLCISQASEMAATKRLSKLGGPSRLSEVGANKKMYRTVVVEASEFGNPMNKVAGNLLEISLFPETSTSDISEKLPNSQHALDVEVSKKNAASTLLADASLQKAEVTRIPQQSETVPLPAGIGSKISYLRLVRRERKSKHSPMVPNSGKKLPVLDEIIPDSDESLIQSTCNENDQKNKCNTAVSLPGSKTGKKVSKSGSVDPNLIKFALRNKKFFKTKLKQDSDSAETSCSRLGGVLDNNLVSCLSKQIGHAPDFIQKTSSKEKESESSASSSTNIGSKLSLSSVDSSANKLGFSSESSDRQKHVVIRADEKSCTGDKGDFSQSSKSSNGEYSSSTAFSEESNLSGSHIGCRPHMSKDTKWDAIRHVQNQHGCLGLRHFELLRKLGGGDIGNVYLGKLTGTECLFAVKVMDNEFLAARKKMPRVQTETEILQMLDHPFLPTLYAQFMTNNFSCLVMDYCPGGDLHVLRQKQLSKTFSEQAVRFYVAEVLLALEYLHMLGVVYRDLKPENILVREDGHIMLTDFDLSLRCAATPTLLKSFPPIESPKRVSSPCMDSGCIDPFCLQPAWKVPCFTPRLESRTRKLKSDLADQISSMPQLIVEPTSARSNSFVGTHEYLAPEIVKGEGHGSPVDWWTFGIFFYELLYGKTPFKGSGNDDTLCNVVSECVKFPESPMVSSQAIDLMRRLLIKDPKSRLGSLKGAAEIKQHAFFHGLNWALIRCAVPPELPKFCDIRSATLDISLHDKDDEYGKEYNDMGEHLEFEMFRQNF